MVVVGGRLSAVALQVSDGQWPMEPSMCGYVGLLNVAYKLRHRTGIVWLEGRGQGLCYKLCFLEAMSFLIPPGSIQKVWFFFNRMSINLAVLNSR